METRLGVGMRMGRGMLIDMGLGGGVLGTPQAFSVSYIIWFWSNMKYCNININSNSH